MAFDLEAQLASNDGVRPTRYDHPRIELTCLTQPKLVPPSEDDDED